MSTPATDNPKPGLSWRTKLALGCVLSPLVIVIVGGIIAGIGYAEFIRRGNNDLQREVAAVRKTEAPLNALELDASYVASEDGADATQEIINNIAFADDDDFRKSIKDLPILGHRLDLKPPPPGTDWPERAAVEAFLEQHQSVLDYCSTLPGRNITARYPAEFCEGVMTRLPHFSPLHRVNGMLSLQIHIDLHAGRPSAAASRIRQQLALAKTLEHEPLMTSQVGGRLRMVGIAIDNLSLLLQHFELSDEELQQLQTDIRPVDAQAALRIALVGERAMYFTEMSLPPEQFDNRRGTPREIVEASVDHMPENAADAAWLLANFRRLIAANDESLHQAWRESEQLKMELDQTATATKLLLHKQSSMLFPSIPDIYVPAIVRADAKCKSMDLLLAAVRYRQLHRQWPAPADQLVADFIPALPSDPFSNQPFNWKVQNDELKIYSVGENGVDDGGQWGDRDFTDLGFALKAKQ